MTAGGLKTAFSSLSSTLTTLRTDVSTKSQTERKVKKAAVGAEASDLTWHVYPKTGSSSYFQSSMEYALLRKLRYSLDARDWLSMDLNHDADGCVWLSFGFAGFFPLSLPIEFASCCLHVCQVCYCARAFFTRSRTHCIQVNLRECRSRMLDLRDTTVHLYTSIV